MHRRLATLLALLLGSACAAPAPTPIQALPGDSARIGWSGAAFSGTQPLRRLASTDQEREEYALYTAADGRRGEVVLIQVRRYRDDVALNPPYGLRTVSGTLDVWRFNDGAVAEVGGIDQVSLPRAGLAYRPYAHTVEDRRCVAFETDWDHWSDDPRRRPLNIVFGYFCQPPGKAFPASRMAAVVDSLTVAGRRERSTTAEGEAATAAPLPDDAGVSGFPFGLARVFSPRDGGDDND